MTTQVLFMGCYQTERLGRPWGVRGDIMTDGSVRIGERGRDRAGAGADAVEERS
jgi:hypothetical protein